MNADAWSTFPSLRALRDRLGSSAAFVETLVADGWSGLHVLEAATANLDYEATRALKGLASDLVSPSAKRFQAAAVESLAHDWLKRAGLLADRDVGFPPSWPSDDPPFDGLIRCPDEIPFDVKDGSGSGLDLLREMLQDCVDAEVSKRGGGVDGSATAVSAGGTADWAAEKQRRPRVSVAVEGPAGQKWFSKIVNEVMPKFAAEVAKIPLPLLEPRRHEFRTGSGVVTVGLNARVGASVMPMREVSGFLEEQIARHAGEKAERLSNLGVSEFLLVYVRTPGAGFSDFRRSTIELALDYLARPTSGLPPSLLGILFLNLDRLSHDSEPEALLWDRLKRMPNSLLAAASELYSPCVTETPSEKRARARTLNPTDVTATISLAGGTCDLQKPCCVAKDVVGAVRVFEAGAETFNVCAECARASGWP